MFVLDKIIVNFIKSLMTNSYLQFSILVGLFAISQILVTDKKVRK